MLCKEELSLGVRIAVKSRAGQLSLKGQKGFCPYRSQALYHDWHLPLKQQVNIDKIQESGHGCVLIKLYF